MKPIQSFVATIFSGGIYLPYWLTNIACSINEIDSNYFPKSQYLKKKLPTYYFIFFFFYFFCFIALISQQGTSNFVWFFLPFMLIGISATWLYFSILFKISNILQELGASLPNKLALFILAIYFITPLILQKQVSKLANKT